MSAKINDITTDILNAYATFTNRDSEWVEQLSISDFVEIRKQAIFELEKNVCTKNKNEINVQKTNNVSNIENNEIKKIHDVKTSNEKPTEQNKQEQTMVSKSTKNTSTLQEKKVSENDETSEPLKVSTTQSSVLNQKEIKNLLDCLDTTNKPESELVSTNYETNKNENESVNTTYDKRHDQEELDLFARLKE